MYNPTLQSSTSKWNIFISLSLFLRKEMKIKMNRYIDKYKLKVTASFVVTLQVSIFRVSVSVLVVRPAARSVAALTLMEPMNTLAGSTPRGTWCVRMEELWPWNSVTWEFLTSSLACVWLIQVNLLVRCTNTRRQFQSFVFFFGWCENKMRNTYSVDFVKGNKEALYKWKHVLHQYYVCVK